MKFRARMVEVLPMKKFYNVLQSMSKICKHCVLRLTAEKVYFIASEPLISGGGLPTGAPSIWCEMEQVNFFNEYKLEGVTPDHPEIFLEIEPDKMLKALSLLKSARTVKIKLTKKHDQPCLTFDMDLTPSLSNSETTVLNPAMAHSRQCVHDVPVNVLPRRLWSDYNEPAMTKPDISIYLPDLKRLKHLVDRYRNLGQFVHLEATPGGKLVLKLETDQVTVSTHFENLEVPAVEHDSEDENDGDEIRVRVDLRHLSLFFSADHISPKRFYVPSIME